MQGWNVLSTRVEDKERQCGGSFAKEVSGTRTTQKMMNVSFNVGMLGVYFREKAKYKSLGVGGLQG